MIQKAEGEGGNPYVNPGLKRWGQKSVKPQNTQKMPDAPIFIPRTLGGKLGEKLREDQTLGRVSHAAGNVKDAQWESVMYRNICLICRDKGLKVKYIGETSLSLIKRAEVNVDEG